MKASSRMHASSSVAAIVTLLGFASIAIGAPSLLFMDESNPLDHPIVFGIVDPENPSVLAQPHSISSASPSSSDSTGERTLSQSSVATLYSIGQVDEPNFDQPCEYKGAFGTCGDYFHLESGIDHGLFCSPSGVCAGEGAACGDDAACGTDLVCSSVDHRCVPEGSFSLTHALTRIDQRRKAASGACPDRSEACQNDNGGFSCVFTDMEVTECGGCFNFGGRDCSRISNALATSCRAGKCAVHACVGGYLPSQDGTACEETDE